VPANAVRSASPTAAEGCGITRRDAEEQGAHRSSGRVCAEHAGDDAEQRHAHAVCEDHPAYARRLRAQCEPHGNLLRTL